MPLPGVKSTDEREPAVVRRPSTERYVDIEISSMRKTIAKRLTESKVRVGNHPVYDFRRSCVNE